MPRIKETYDTEDQFDWSFIRTTYSKGQVADEYILFDDGSEASRTYDRGAIVSEVRTDNPDTPSANPWSEIRTVFDANGAPASVITTYDSGVVQTDSYSDGVLTQSIRQDDPATNAEPWDSVVTLYDADGQIQSRETVYDTGVVTTDSYVAGTLAYSLSVDSSATNAEPWQQIERFYDAQGHLQNEVTTYDNGIVETVWFTDGVMSHRTQYDAPENDAAEWTQIDSYYDALGQLLREVTIRDDAVVEDANYVDGVLSSRTSYDDPANNAVEWEQIEESFDAAGELASKTIVYDDGIVDQSTYSGGRITYRVQTDDPSSNVAEWERIESRYDRFSGVLAEEVTYFDNGILEEQYFENGVLAYRVQTDDPYVNAAEWERIESYYDPYTGAPVAEITLFDNGIVDEKYFDYGVLTYRVQTDFDPYVNAAEWERIETYYDPYTGAPAAEVTLFDNGIVDEKFFDNGVLTYRVQTDFDPYTNAAEWERIESYYDPYSGDLSAEVTTYDNGVIGEDIYQDGLLSSRTLLDNPNSEGAGAFDWTGKFVQFEADTLVFDATLFDDQDYTRSDYDAEGLLMTVWDYDGDGDMPWLGRKTEYNPDGSELDVIYWYEGDTLPPEIDPYAMAIV